MSRGGEEAGASRGVDENDGGIGSKRGVVFSGEACTRGRQSADRWTDEVECGEDSSETKPEIAWQTQEHAEGDRQMCSEVLRGGTPLEELQLRLERLTRRVGGWVKWRSFVGKGCWLQKGMGEMELGVGRVHEELLSGGRKQGDDNSGQASGDYFFHGQFEGLSSPLCNPLIKSMKQGIKRAHVDNGTQERARRPLMWGMLTRMQESFPYWEVGGGVVFIGLALPYFLTLRASELFTGEKGDFHNMYCLRRGDVAFSELTSS